MCGYQLNIIAFFSITDPKHDVQNTSLHGNGQKNIKDKNVIAINAYEEIVEVPVYSKPLSTSNPMFLQTGRVKHSSISSKKSVSSQKSFENLRGSLSPRVFDEKGDNNKNFETESSIKETHDHSSNENVIDQYSGIITSMFSTHVLHKCSKLLHSMHFIQF